MADLQRASLSDVRAFHDHYYVPNNAVLSIAGDFDPAQAMELVRRHFGAIPRRDLTPWRDPGMAPQTAERVGSIDDPRAELPAFHIAYHIPPRRTPDHYALEILASVLADGESSRLYQELIKERQVASTIEVDTDDRRGPDLFTVWCVLSQGHTPAEVRPMVLAAIDAIAHGGITGHELEKARNRIRSSFVFGFQSNLQRASHLGEFELYDGNARLLRTELDRYLSVSLDDVRRVAAQYLVATNRTMLDVVPRGGGASPAPASGPPAGSQAGGAR